MAANRFDQAAEMPIINTYVPIDFNNLYRIGVTQQEAIRQATQDFGQALEKFGEFYSPSDIDTNNWYNLTINRKDIQSLLNRMVSDPDSIKDAGFRASLAGAINRTDYAALGRLKQSRQGLLARQEANQRLMLSGNYNPLIHNVDYSNYDTLNTGIYNDVSPLPYTSVVEMVRPYVDDLEDSFIGVQNGWIHRGVTPERTDQQIHANWSNIVNTPGYSQNLEIIMKQNPGIDVNTATELLNAQIITAGREFTRDNAERDPWSLYVAKKQYEYANDDNSSRGLMNLTELVHNDLKRNDRINTARASSLNGDAQSRYIEYGLEGLTAEERGQLAPALSDSQRLARNLSILEQQIPKHDGDFYSAARDVAMYSSVPLGEQASDIYTRQAAGNGKQYADGSYEVSNLKNFLPLDQIGFKMSGVGREMTQWGDWDLTEKRDKLWNAENLQAKVIAGGRAISTNTEAFNSAYLYIPYKQVRKYMNDSDIYLSGGDIADRSFDEVSTTVTNRFDYAGNPDGSSIVTRGKTEKYVRFPVASLIPSKGQAANEADAVYNKYIGLSSSARDTQIDVSQRTRQSTYDYIPHGLQYDPNLD